MTTRQILEEPPLSRVLLHVRLKHLDNVVIVVVVALVREPG